jgi:hypothetical protein
LTSISYPPALTAPSKPIALSVKRLYLLWIALAGLALIWWLPGGFGMTAILDEWTMLLRASTGDLPIFYPEAAPTRPLTYIPWILAWALTPESFLGLNLVMLAVHWLKGAAMLALLLRLVPTRPAFAWIGAALFMLYPADHGMFYPGILNSQLSSALAIIAVERLLAHWQRPTPLRLALMLTTQALTVLTYEAGIPLLLCAPALLIWLERGISRRFWRFAAIWTAIPLVWMGYIVYTLVGGGASYQASLIDLGGERWELLHGLSYMLSMNYITGFRLGAETGRRALTGEQPLIFLVAAASIGVAAALIAAWADHQSEAMTRRRWLTLALIGFAAVFAGFAMYIPTRDFSTQHYTWRLSMFTAIGAAVSISAALMLLPRRAAYAAAGILILLAALRGLSQHQRFINWSKDQLAIVRAVTETVRVPPDGTLIAIIDASPNEHVRAFRLNYVFEHALQLMYGSPRLFGRVCYDDATSPRPHETCRFEDDTLIASGIWAGFDRFPLDRVILFYYDDSLSLLESIPERYLNGASAASYNPARLIDPASPLPARYDTMFGLN